ncbi:MAG: hypothetical protein E7551_01425 [Ruminococcaceae bacterium]|nr:hypothetical protein [Oscillospiraceae bacterium]
MHKRILFALDLEGVNFVVGAPYIRFGDTPDYKVAVREAATEINAAAEALFSAGVTKIDVWDNHAGGGNLSQDMLDSRVTLLKVDPTLPRMSFAQDKYDCICYFGYHTMEGTLGGVLAHTMNGFEHQYYKINGKYIGEIDIDCGIAAEHSMPSVFFAGGDLTCKQAAASVPDIITVVTKEEISRNKAIFRNNDELLAEIKEKIQLAVNKEATLKRLIFPLVFEKSFKRVERAAEFMEDCISFNLDADYLSDEVMGKDGHTVVINIKDINEFLKVI